MAERPSPRLFDRLPGGVPPVNPDPESQLEVKLFLYPERLYAIHWRDIAKIETYPALILGEAKNLLSAREFAPAFEHLNFLLNNYPNTPGLEQLRFEFLLTSAAGMLQSGNLAHGLAVLEEFHRAYPDNQRSAQVLAKISEIADRMIGELSPSRKFGRRAFDVGAIGTRLSGSVAGGHTVETEIHGDGGIDSPEGD